MIAGFGGQMFLTAVAIAFPVTLILLLVQFAAGVVSRAAPSAAIEIDITYRNRRNADSSRSTGVATLPRSGLVQQ